MKLSQLQHSINEIAKINPLTNKSINNGYRSEILVKYEKTGVLNYKLDNTSYTKNGDLDKTTYKYQIKANRNEVKVLKEIGIVPNNLEELIEIYIKYNKANRYIYVLNIDETSYIITMNKQEFKEFVMKWYRFSNSRRTARINIKDTTILKWAMENA